MIYGVELNIAFTIAFLTLGIPLLLLELYGVWRRVKDEEGNSSWGGDTISENWWALRNRYPWLGLPMGAFLAWLFYHFIVEGWGR